jgi:hypothetical protein
VPIARLAAGQAALKPELAAARKEVLKAYKK